MTNLAPLPPTAQAAQVAALVAPVTSPKFFHAGNAVFTVTNPTGERFTFRARRPKAKNPTDTPPVFLGILSGPNNETDYAYAGIVCLDGSVKITKASKFQLTAKPVLVAAWAMRLVIAGKPMPAGYAIHHEGRCCRCGRTLTTPESVARGMGDDCASQVGPECAGKVIL